MKTFGFLVVLCFLTVPAFADPTSDAKAHSAAFEKAANARDTKAVLALYADDAVVIWPGQGEEAGGKAEIEKMVSKFVGRASQGRKDHAQVADRDPARDRLRRHGGSLGRVVHRSRRQEANRRAAHDRDHQEAGREDAVRRRPCFGRVAAA